MKTVSCLCYFRNKKNRSRYRNSANFIIICTWELKWNKTSYVTGTQKVFTLLQKEHHLVVIIWFSCACVRAQLLQSRPILCNPMDWGPPGSSVHRFSRQEYWSGLPCPPPGDLPEPRIKLVFPASSPVTSPIKMRCHQPRMVVRIQ